MPCFILTIAPVKEWQTLQPIHAQKQADIQARAKPTSSASPRVLSLTPTALGILAAFQRRWLLAISIGITVGAGAAISLWFLSPAQTYTARTLLHMASLQPYLLSETPDTRVIFQDYQRTQLAYAKSRRVLNAALRAPNVKVLEEVTKEVDPVVWLEKKVTVDYTVSPEIMRISISGTEPNNLKTLVEAVREAYLNEVVDKEYKNRLDRLELLKELYSQYELGLKKKREDLKVLANGLGSTNPKTVAVKQEFAWKELHTIQSELMGVQSELRKAMLEVEGQSEPVSAGSGDTSLAAAAIGLAGSPLGFGVLPGLSTLIAAKNRSNESALPNTLIEVYLKKDAEFDRCFQQVAQLEKQRDFFVANTNNPDKEPAYKRIVRDLEAAKKALATCREEARPRAIKQARENAFGEAGTGKQHAQARVLFLNKLQGILAEEVEKRSKLGQDTAKQTIDLEWLKDEIDAVDSTGKKVSGQIQSLQVEIRADKRIRSMDDTAVLDDGNKRIRTSGMGFIGGLLVSILGISYLEFRARRVSNPEQLTDGLQLKLLGTMPVVSQSAAKARKSQALTVDRQFQKYLVESVDATRLVLLHTTQHDSAQVLLTSSAFGGEGKTMLSCHLAVNLATAGFRTLLIDADLRRPAVQKVFHIANEPGLCEVLRSEVDLASAIRQGPVENMSLLMAGDCKEQPTKLLACASFSNLLPVLREQYDYIIVDSAPLLPVVDSQFIAQHVDGVILSVIRNVSRLPAVHAACERLVSLDVRILGVVVHGVENDSYYHDYTLASREATKV
jgi:capsular exopolysaccharide synthesis family protein